MSGEGEESAEGEKSMQTYSEVQALLKTVQDNVWKYLTVHLRRILDGEILLRIVDEEMKYEADQDGVKSQTARKRMPWQAYRDIVLELLPDGSGAHELSTLMALCRENGNSAGRWMQRLKIGKTHVEKVGAELPDKLYVDLAIRYLTQREMSIMAVSITSGSTAEKLSPIQAKREIMKLSFEKLDQLIKTSLHPGDTRYRKSMHRHLSDTRVYTLEQAKEYLNVYQPREAVSARKPPADPRRRKPGPVCKKCTDAGLKGKNVRHKTEDCVDMVRKANIERFIAPKNRKRQRGRAVNFSSSKRPRASSNKGAYKPPPDNVEECETCRKAGRAYRHPQQWCKYAPGGPWHGKSGEELRALKKQYFEARKRNRSLTHTVYQDIDWDRFQSREEAADWYMKNTNPFGPYFHHEVAWFIEQELEAMTKDLEDPAQHPSETYSSNAQDGWSEETYPGGENGELQGVDGKTAITSITPNHPEGENASAEAEGITSSSEKLPFFEGLNAMAPAPPFSQVVDYENGKMLSDEVQRQPENLEEEASESPPLPKICIFRPSVDQELSCQVCLTQRSSQIDGGNKAQGMDERFICLRNCAGKSWKKRSLVSLSAINPYVCAADGSSSNPIDLTAAAAPDKDLEQEQESCYMMTDGGYSAESDSDGGLVSPDSDCIYVTIQACGPDEEPYPDCEHIYYWYLDQPMWMFLDCLRVDYPVWGNYFDIILPCGRRLNYLQRPGDLGFLDQDHVVARLVMQHLPNASAGYSFVRRQNPMRPEQRAEFMEAHMAAAAAVSDSAAAAAARENQEMIEEVEAAAENATKVIVLEIWSGQERCMSVRWGKSQPV